MSRTTQILLVLIFATTPLVGCSKKADRAGTEAPSAGAGGLAGPEPKEYADTVEEAKDLPNALQAQVGWVMQPITEAATVADDLASLKSELELDASAFNAMARAAFKDGTVEIAADVELDEDSRARVEATLRKLKNLGVNLESVPARAKIAVKNVVRLVAKAPILARKAAKELKGSASASAQADAAAVRQMPSQVRGEVSGIKAKIIGLPKEAAAATAKLSASFAAGG